MIMGKFNTKEEVIEIKTNYSCLLHFLSFSIAVSREFITKPCETSLFE